MVSLHSAAAGRIAAVPARSARYWACLLWLPLAWSAAVDAQTPPWRTLSDKDGIRLEARSIPGERFDELRVTASVKVSPQTVADYLLGRYLDEKNKNIDRRFVQRGPDRAIWSDVLSTPVTSDRCYSMRFDRHALAGGEIRVKFVALDYIGKTPKPDCVALRSRGEWTLTPTTAGTRLTYSSLTDIGGKTPAFLAQRSLASAAVSSVSKVVAGASGRPLPRGIGD